MGLKEVLIFTITYEGKDYVLDEFIKHALAIDYPNKKHVIIDNSNDDGAYTKKLKEKLEPLGFEIYHVSRGNNSREALARSQNMARKIMLEGSYDYTFSLESDILVPPNIIQELMVFNKPCIGAMYYIGDPKKIRVPCITILDKKDTGLLGTRLLKPDEFSDYTHKGLKQIASCGLGATLIKREVLEKFHFFYHPTLRGHSDIFFYNDLYNNGIPAYVNTDIVVKHKNMSWELVEDR